MAWLLKLWHVFNESYKCFCDLRGLAERNIPVRARVMRWPTEPGLFGDFENSQKMTQRLTTWKWVRSVCAVCVCPGLYVQYGSRHASVTLDMKRGDWKCLERGCSLGLNLRSECNWGKLNVATRSLLTTNLPHPSLCGNSSWFIMQKMQIVFTYTDAPWCTVWQARVWASRDNIWNSWDKTREKIK